MVTVPRRWRAATLLAVAALLAGCSGESAAPTTTTSVTAPLVVMVEGLCTARAQAPTDVKSARTTFYDRSHDALHTLARDLEPVDRALAARLLEAKEAVEADVNAGPPKPTLADDLDHLLDVTRQGLARLSVNAPACR